MLIFGKHAVFETIKSHPEKIISIIINSVRKNNITLPYDIQKLKVELLTEKKFEEFLRINKIKGNHQGILALIDDFPYSKSSEIIKHASEKNNAVLILDEIQDPHNFGAIIRTAYATGIEGIITTSKNTVPVTDTVIKVSSGAANYLKISREGNIYKAIEILKNNGYRIIGTSLKSDKYLFKSGLIGKVAVIFGNESRGLRKRLLQMCDEIIKIPMINQFDSLNVSVAVGIVLYETLRQRMMA
ncbi:MAG: 23S rRNA (guanosine(2251)-2'-O)-methyltransferase RlmB [Ignavibacteria bacterium]|nr:23S rRNA (guanosine(2251)-2'-O)-methyltransferase RlmB [Ignavibacteria bacterium]